MTASNGYRSRMWRSLIEPYSGKKYFYSFSLGNGGPGEIGIFGDRGFGVAYHLMGLDVMSSYSGDYKTLRKYWRDNEPLAPPHALKDGKYLTVDKMFGYIKNVHDWAWMEDGSNDCGDNGPVVDCSQAPFAGHCAWLRIAKKVGNEQDISRAAYHLAKGQLSLIARLPFADYGRENGILGVDHLNVGFRECITPNCFSNQPMINLAKKKRYFGSYLSTLSYADKFDNLEMYFSYARYIWPDLRRYEEIFREYYPHSDTERMPNYNFLSRLMYQIIDGMPLSRAWTIYENTTKEAPGSWKASSAINNMPLLLSGGSPIVITSWYPTEVPDFKFTPSLKTAIVKFKTVPANYQLMALSSARPISIKANGKDISDWKYDSATYQLTINIPAGENVSVSIVYSKIDTNHFTPIPIPPKEKSLPQIDGNIDYFKFQRANVTNIHNQHETSKTPQIVISQKDMIESWGASKKEINRTPPASIKIISTAADKNCAAAVTSQSVSVVPGALYHLSFMIRGNVAIRIMAILINGNSKKRLNLEQRIIVATEKWKDISRNFIVPTGTEKVQIHIFCWKENGWFEVKNFKLIQKDSH